MLSFNEWKKNNPEKYNDWKKVCDDEDMIEICYDDGIRFGDKNFENYFGHPTCNNENEKIPTSAYLVLGTGIILTIGLPIFVLHKILKRIRKRSK